MIPPLKLFPAIFKSYSSLLHGQWRSLALILNLNSSLMLGFFLSLFLSHFLSLSVVFLLSLSLFLFPLSLLLSVTQSSGRNRTGYSETSEHQLTL